MVDELLKKYTERLHPDEEDAPTRDLDAAEDLGCFGYLRSRRDRCPMLELRKRSGSCLAVPYSWIEAISFDPSTGIVIRAGVHKVEIKGKNLNADFGPTVRLFEGLTRHRVSWIQEASATMHSAYSTGSCIVESVSW